MQKEMTDIEDGKQDKVGKQVVLLRERTEGSEHKQSKKNTLKSTINIFWANWSLIVF